MKPRCIWQLLLLFCVFSQTLYSQSVQKIRFNNIRKSEGLSNNMVNGIIRDNLGFLWIATNDGLCRYDGPNQIEVFRVSDEEGGSTLKSSNIRSIYEDSKGNLWIGTRLGGLTKYHRKSNTWRTYQHNEQEPNTLSNDEVLSIIEDSQQRLWVGTENGLNLFDYETETFTRFMSDASNPNSLKTKAVLDVFEDDKGWIWVGTWGGGLHLLLKETDREKKQGKFRQIRIGGSSSAQNVWKIYQDRQKRYWIGAHGGGLFLMQLPSSASNHLAKQDWTPQFHNYIENEGGKESISSNSVQDILQDRTGKLWICTGFGINCIEEKDLPDPEKYNTTNPNRPELKFVNFHFSAQDIYSIADNNVIQVVEDEQGLMWFATANGISLHNWYTNQFDTHSIFTTGEKTSSAKNMHIDDTGIMWIGGGEYGLTQYNAESGKKNNFTNEHPEIFLDNYVASITGKRNGRMYVATKKGVSVFNIKNYQYKRYPIPAWLQEQITDFYVQFIFVDSQDKIWLGTEVGLFSINQKTGVYTKYLKDLSNPYSISDNSINDMVEDKQGNLWIATFNGLNKVSFANRADFKCIRFLYDKAHPENTIIGNQIISLELIDDKLYLGSTAGLGSYDLKTERFKSYSVNSHKFWIQSIEPTKNGDFWASSTLGLFHFDTKKEKFNVFEEIDGLSDLSFLLGASAQDNQGYIYFGNRSGFTRFHSEQFSQNKQKPKVYLTSIKKVNHDGEKIFNGTNKQEIELNHNDYYLSINFAALNYNRGEKNQYAYKLEGFDDAWSYTQFGIPIVYTNLEPQTYTFRVKAANNDGIWNEEGATLKIIKHPAFWQTWWFRLGGLLFSLMTLVVGVNLYTGSIRRKNLVLKGYNDKLNKEIDEREKVEKALADKERFNGIVMDNIPQFIYWVDKDYKLLGSNQTFRNFLSFDSREIIGKTIADYPLPLHFIEEEKALLKRVIDTEKPIYNKVLKMFPSPLTDGKWIERNFIPLRNDDGTVIGMLVSGRDITDRVTKERVIAKHSEKLEEYNSELKRSNKDLEQFAYIASHDLKEPLRMIGNFSGLLARTYKTKLDKDAFEYIDFIEDGVSRMSSLINSLLTYSRVGRKEMKLVDIDLNKLVEVKLFDLSELTKDRNAVIEMDELPTILGEKEQVGMVYYNLINNGIKFNKKDQPKISIRHHENAPKGFWQFSVQDNGIGIEPQYQKQIFEIFRRLHNKRDFEGTGIGLSVCQKIIFRHGGKIWLESVPGEGTTFYFTISKNLKNILPAIEKEVPMPTSLS